MRQKFRPKRPAKITKLFFKDYYMRAFDKSGKTRNFSIDKIIYEPLLRRVR